MLDVHAPASVKTRTIRHKPAWFTKSVRDARRIRRRYERRWRKSGLEADRQRYMEAHRNVTDTISKEKKVYYNDKLNSNILILN